MSDFCSKYRKIIHIDMDAFYASVEIRDNPALKGFPVAIGGHAHSRGVVATASYEARRFGVRSAMPCYKAAKLCPELIFVRPRFERYKEVSDTIRGVFYRWTDLVEPLSLDEAYLDVTHQPDDASYIAEEIRKEIVLKTGLSASAGVGPNKLIAKIASDYRKPDGLTVVDNRAVECFMKSLPINKIPGVGPVSTSKLKQEGYFYCPDVWGAPRERLVALLGYRFADSLMRRSRGIDESPVVSKRERKSLGHELTFNNNLVNLNQVETNLIDICQKLSRRLIKSRQLAAGLTLKYKYSDFVQATRSAQLIVPGNLSEELIPVALSLMKKAKFGGRPVRLLGLTATRLERQRGKRWVQPLLFDTARSPE